jgi:integrase
VPKTTPSYRRRGGRAIVTLTDAVTKQRRDFPLGYWDTPESREAYHRTIAEWEAAGRRLTNQLGTSGDQDGPSLNEVMLEYWRHVQERFTISRQQQVKDALRVVRSLYGTEPAIAFGPRRLKVVRLQMIEKHDWSRTYIKGQIQRIRQMFRWAAGEELIPISVYEQLTAVQGLRVGESGVRETSAVQPIADEMVDAIEPFVSRQVWAIVQLQRLTAARGGELFGLRPADLEMAGHVWSVDLARHKTAHRGRRRTLLFGPEAQAVIAPFLAGRALQTPLFSPAEAESERRSQLTESRRTPASCGNSVGKNRLEAPSKSPGEQYTTASYRRAIQVACDRAFALPANLARQKVRGSKHMRWESSAEWQSRLGDRWPEVAEWRKAHRWHPHQLRHTAATRIRRSADLEAASIILGHSSAELTDKVYAERDLTKAVEVMRRIG